MAEGCASGAHNENVQLKQQLHQVTEYNKELIEEINAVRAEIDRIDRETTQTISSQNFDIERLVRENKALQSSLEQQKILAESKNFSSGELEERLVYLTEDNRSLNSKYELVVEELQVK